MSQKELVKQIAETLRLDATLVALVEHTSSDIRIARDRPPIKAKLPFLGIRVFESNPLVSGDVTHFQIARIHFKAYGLNETNIIDIADRLDLLLQPERSGASNAYYDFSGGSISTRSTRWKTRGLRDFDDETDVWNEIVEADIVWVPQACP